jgi:hypothetical protein
LLRWRCGAWPGNERPACLANQWGKIQLSGKIEISVADLAAAKQIASAAYHPDSGRLSINFRDGTTAEFEA